MSDVEALIRVGMKSPRWGQVTVADASELRPCDLPLVAALPQLMTPDAAEPRAKQRKAGEVPGNGVVVVVASDDLL